MRRRELCAGIAASAAGQQTDLRPAAASESLYVPKAHKVADLALLHDTMEEFSFVELVTPKPTLRITHIPVGLDRKSGAYGTIYGHVARQNPQGAAFDGRNQAAIVFRGPHSYISPSWYAQKRAVPTWNFVAVHATGRPRPVTDESELHEILARLVVKSEGKYANGAYDFEALPKDYVAGMMRGIIGFRMEIESLEGKFKLGQERSEGDRQGILQHLDGARKDRSLREITLSFYQRGQ